MTSSRALRFVCLLAIGAAAAVSCVHHQSVEIPVHDVTPAGRDAVVSVNVPADWRPLGPSSSLAEFLAPDRRSRVYVRAMPTGADIKRCPTIARQYASEFIGAWGGPPGTKVASRISSGDRVDFELRRVDPKPDGEVIWARVVCRDGALAITSCTVPTIRERELRPRCRDIVNSLQVVALSKSQAKAESAR